MKTKQSINNKRNQEMNAKQKITVAPQQMTKKDILLLASGIEQENAKLKLGFWLLVTSVSVTFVMQDYKSYLARQEARNNAQIELSYQKQQFRDIHKLLAKTEESLTKLNRRNRNDRHSN